MRSSFDLYTTVCSLSSLNAKNCDGSKCYLLSLGQKVLGIHYGRGELSHIWARKFFKLRTNTHKVLFEFGDWGLWTVMLCDEYVTPQISSPNPQASCPAVLSLANNSLVRSCLSTENFSANLTVSEQSVWHEGSQVKYKLFCKVIFSETFHMGLNTPYSQHAWRSSSYLIPIN